MIFRLIILFVVVWFLIWMLKKQFSDKTSDKSLPNDQAGEDMIACDYCGAHAPKSLVIKSGDKHYCCEEHASLDD